MKKPKDYLVFPLDMPSLYAALPYIEGLSDHVGMFKVGLELFIRCGPEIIDAIRQRSSATVFLDLKLHDIPATVERAMQVVADLEVGFVTVHCGDSIQMLEAAVKGGKGRVAVLGVTVLTSVSAEDIRKAGYGPAFYQDVRELVLHRGRMAKQAGCAGLVCSGQEVAMIRQELGSDLVTVTPGIRPAGKRPEGDDQARVMTPAEAIRNGADYLVIGRPIRDAVDPVQAAVQIAAEIEQALLGV